MANGVLLFLSTSELFFIGLVLVMLFGSKKIPEIARGLGKGIRDFKNATGDIQEEIRRTSSEIQNSAKTESPDKKKNSPETNSKEK